jgi:serine protease Do
MRSHINLAPDSMSAAIALAPHSLGIYGGPVVKTSLRLNDQVHVGDRVLAIGNPLGLQGTVTSGIVSALHRDPSGPYDEFIQTDAAINHGNSGGPLFNTHGEVIGINNQIVSESPTSGSIGLGFAIPSNDVQFMLEQVRRYGRPHIGWLGIRVQALTPDVADVLAIDRHSGAIIAEVAADGPGGRAGLQIGDVVQGFAHETVTDYRELNRAVMMSVGKTMKLRFGARVRRESSP